MSYGCTFPIDFVLAKFNYHTNVWGINLIFASRKLGMCSKIEHNIIEAITITCCEY